jgi:hypothetical protein
MLESISEDVSLPLPAVDSTASLWILIAMLLDSSEAVSACPQAVKNKAIVVTAIKALLLFIFQKPP